MTKNIQNDLFLLSLYFRILINFQTPFEGDWSFLEHFFVAQFRETLKQLD